MDNLTREEINKIKEKTRFYAKVFINYVIERWYPEYNLEDACNDIEEGSVNNILDNYYGLPQNRYRIDIVNPKVVQTAIDIIDNDELRVKLNEKFKVLKYKRIAEGLLEKISSIVYDAEYPELVMTDAEEKEEEKQREIVNNTYKFHYYKDSKGALIFLIEDWFHSFYLVSRKDKDISFILLTPNEYYCNTCKQRFHALIEEKRVKGSVKKDVQAVKTDLHKDVVPELEKRNTCIIRCLFCGAELYHDPEYPEKYNITEDTTTAQLMEILKKQNKEQLRRKTYICVMCGKEMPPTKSWNRIYCSPRCKDKARLIKDVDVKEKLKQLKKILRVGKYASYKDKKAVLFREHEPLREETESL